MPGTLQTLERYKEEHNEVSTLKLFRSVRKSPANRQRGESSGNRRMHEEKPCKLLGGGAGKGRWEEEVNGFKELYYLYV